LILPDTSIWIEFLRGRSPYQQILRHHLEIGNIMTIGCIFGELLQGARTQKEADRLLAYYNALQHGEESGLWPEAGLLSYTEKALSRGVGLMDLAIITAGRRAGAKIWSRDKKLLSLLKKEEKFHAKK